MNISIYIFGFFCLFHREVTEVPQNVSIGSFISINASDKIAMSNLNITRCEREQLKTIPPLRFRTHHKGVYVSAKLTNHVWLGNSLFSSVGRGLHKNTRSPPSTKKLFSGKELFQEFPESPSQE